MNRELKVECLHITDEGGYGASREVSLLRLKGKWLAEAGFEAGMMVDVSSDGSGRLVIERKKGD